MVEREALFEEHLIAPRGQGRLASAEHAGAAGRPAAPDSAGGPGRRGARCRGGLLGEQVRRGWAAGSAVVELVEGAELLSVARLTAEDVARALGGLSPGATARGRPGGGRSTSRARSGGPRRARQSVRPTHPHA